MQRPSTKETNTAVIIVTHNLGIVARFAERIYVMYSGSVVEMTDAKRLFANTGRICARSAPGRN
ncbi:hypothetical protein AALB39_09125 [Lachnospiraceae bacterium 54-53]